MLYFLNLMFDKSLLHSRFQMNVIFFCLNMKETTFKESQWCEELLFIPEIFAFDLPTAKMKASSISSNIRKGSLVHALRMRGRE